MGFQFFLEMGLEQSLELSLQDSDVIKQCNRLNMDRGRYSERVSLLMNRVNSFHWPRVNNGF